MCAHINFFLCSFPKPVLWPKNNVCFLHKNGFFPPAPLHILTYLWQLVCMQIYDATVECPSSKDVTSMDFIYLVILLFFGGGGYSDRDHGWLVFLLLCCLWCLGSQLLYHSSAERSGGPLVYATVRWQAHSTGWEDCVCDRFLLPHHVGSHTSSLDDLFQFSLEGGCCYAGSLSWLKTVPT